jgi:glycosyltransferase involved in cell wall biosynthesis
VHRINAGKNSKLLLYVGRLVPEKNLQLLVDTLAQLNAASEVDWRLVVVGDGIGREAFLSQGEKRVPARIGWLGHIRNRAELAETYANCDFFVHPNPHEPFGIAPLEAMASGLPLIVPDRGGVLSYANSSNAWIAQPTAIAFAQAIREATLDDALRERRIASALLTAQQFGWENVADLFLDLYEEMVRSKSADLCGSRPDFVSSPPGRGSPRMARATAYLLQHLLATRES